MKLGIDLKVDYAFKWSFGVQEWIENLRSLLEHTLGNRIRCPLQELTIVSPILDRALAQDKLSILDILARDKQGKRYHIEMQMIGYADLPQRFLYYSARTYWSQLKESEEYADLEPDVVIVLHSFGADISSISMDCPNSKL